MRWFVLTCFVLALGVGFLFVQTEDPQRQEALATWFAGLLGLAMLGLADDGRRRGRVRGKRTTVERHSHPITFWSITGTYYAVGVALLGAAVWRTVT